MTIATWLVTSEPVDYGRITQQREDGRCLVVVSGHYNPADYRVLLSTQSYVEALTEYTFG